MPSSTFSTNASGKLVDFYEELGVTKTATTKEIQSAYRKLALKYHPDKNPNNPAAAEIFKQLTRYKEVLEDESKRKRYDEDVAGGRNCSRQPQYERRDTGNSSRSEPSYSSSSRSRSDNSSSRSSNNDDDIYETYWRNQPDPPVYRESERTQKSRPTERESSGRQRSPERREYQYRDRYTSSSKRRSQDRSSSRRTDSDRRNRPSGVYRRPSPTAIRDRSARAVWLYDDILARCKRICKKVVIAIKLLETLEEIGTEELKATKRNRGSHGEHINAGLFCIMVDVLFDIIEASTEVYSNTLWILDIAVDERHAMDYLRDVDAKMRGLEGSWLVTEELLQTIDEGMERDGWPVSTITYTLEKIVKTWYEDIDLPSDLYEVIKIVRKAKVFEYQMNRSKRTITIDRS